MRRQRDRTKSTILLLVISATAAYVTTYTVLSFNSALSPTQPSSASVPLSEGSFLAVNSNSNCRQVLGKSFPLYATAGQIASYLETVDGGQQVGLERGTNTVVGEDGLPYIYVSVPYGSQNSRQGYIQAQVQNASTGNTRSTLGMCDSSSNGSSTNNPQPDPPDSGPVGGYW